MPEVRAAAASTIRRPTPLDWILRVVIAIFFVFQGIDKFGSRMLWIRLFAEIGIGQWFRYATGVVEIVGAVLLLVPRATLIAVALLTCTMVGAFLVHVFIIGVGPQSVFVAVLITVILTIGWRHHAASTRRAVAAPSASSVS